ncbi:5,6-dimethylbenzimidazole synthase [Iodidimonas sp. SYSU 1G8]|uniref:5,6-dimethylbenzimidazole synthase n=1 Tax=Iodidimonas sp. SYSU 1G8 TaxID=3133967 RepID=UPI0031FEBA38
MTAREPGPGQDALENLESLLAWRRDVRRFRTDPVPDMLVRHLLDLAALAPSVGNSQPWRFVRVTTPALREAVAENFRAANYAALAGYEGEKAALYQSLKLAGLDAPVHLAVFTDMEPRAGHGLGRRTMPETLVHSTVCAIHTLWLAARAAGLGIGWLSILDPERLARDLAMPAAWRFTGYLCVGYPEEEHLDPELERHGWQARNPAETFIFDA